MDNKEGPLDIYLMGIGGTGMGAFAGLLKQKGHRVFGSDNAVYSPMKEKLDEWKIPYRIPYRAENLPQSCDLVIVGNVIRKDNEEALALQARNLPYDSFPSALNKFFLKDAISIVASGTHGKTTCSSLLAHTLAHAGYDPGFLIGGIPLNFGESFRASFTKNGPFVVEGDEYDTAYFDKRPKFIHYDPQFLLVTSLEFDHGDIYRDVDAIIDAFASLFKTLKPSDVVVINGRDQNIKTALSRASCAATIIGYGDGDDFFATDKRFDENGISFNVACRDSTLGEISIPLFGEHNLANALGCYAILHHYGLSHQEISAGFKTFRGVKRRLEEKRLPNGRFVVDDFAHHPTAVRETLKAARQKYPEKNICAIFEPRSATTCMKIFETHYEDAFLLTDKVLFAPVGRDLNKADRLDTEKIAQTLTTHGIEARAFLDYETLRRELPKIDHEYVLLFMSNGDFKGLLADVERVFS